MIIFVSYHPTNHYESRHEWYCGQSSHANKQQQLQGAKWEATTEAGLRHSAKKKGPTKGAQTWGWGSLQSSLPLRGRAVAMSVAAPLLPHGGQFSTQVTVAATREPQAPAVMAEASSCQSSLLALKSNVYFFLFEPGCLFPPSLSRSKSQSLTNTFSLSDSSPRGNPNEDEAKAETIRNLRKSFASLFSD